MGIDRMPLKLDLRLFDGGAAGGNGGGAGLGTGAGGAGKGAGAAQTGEAGLPSAAGKGRKAGTLAGVRYGRQESSGQTGGAPMGNTAAGVASGSGTAGGGASAGSGGESETAAQGNMPDAKRAEFERLIQGDYKDLFSERIQSIIDRRFKETKTLQAQAEKTKPIFELLAARYGVTDGDMDKLTEAVQSDDSFYAEEAAEKGMSAAQLRQIKAIERENAELKAARQEMERRQQTERVYADWMNQAEQMKTIYPKFDLGAESRNPEFVRLLQTGVSVKAAYQALHMDDIMGGAMQYTAQKIQQQTVNSIRTRAERPSENGLSSQSGVVVKNDVSKLTVTDRREIARRVARGEQIQF